MNREPASKKDLELVEVELHGAIDEVKADVAELKGDVSELKIDVTELKQDVGVLKQDMKGVKKDIAILTVQTSQNTADLLEFKEQNNRQMDTVITAIDGLAKLITNGQVEKTAAESALRRHDNRLEDHETRIGVLEQKTA